jgi:hypothetical protein
MEDRVQMHRTKTYGDAVHGQSLSTPSGAGGDQEC